jgi:hypothetical protein
VVSAYVDIGPGIAKDVVIIEIATGHVLKRWNERGSEAVVLLNVLRKDLERLSLASFTQEWSLDPPPGPRE